MNGFISHSYKIFQKEIIAPKFSEKERIEYSTLQFILQGQQNLATKS